MIDAGLKAIALVEKWGDGLTPDNETQMMLEIAHTIREAITEAYEDAAKVADARAALWRSKSGDCATSLEEECEDIAAAIRSKG